MATLDQRFRYREGGADRPDGEKEKHHSLKYEEKAPKEYYTLCSGDLFENYSLKYEEEALKGYYILYCGGLEENFNLKYEEKVLKEYCILCSRGLEMESYSSLEATRKASQWTRKGIPSKGSYSVREYCILGGGDPEMESHCSSKATRKENQVTRKGIPSKKCHSVRGDLGAILEEYYILCSGDLEENYSLKYEVSARNEYYILVSGDSGMNYSVRGVRGALPEICLRPAARQVAAE